MIRILSIAILVLGLGATGATAQQKVLRSMVPAGGMWQSLPYASAPRAAHTDQAAKFTASSKKNGPRAAAKAATAPAKARTKRKPVPAASVPKRPPAETAAARTKELSRRIEALAPGTRLDEPIADPENPPWRHKLGSRANIEGRDLAMPLDEKGKAGFVARGYHQQPTWNNPHGNTGATFLLRQRF